MKGYILGNRAKERREERSLMNIMIVGCGKVGSAILESLVSEEHDIVAIDTDRKVLEEKNNIYEYNNTEQ